MLTLLEQPRFRAGLDFLRLRGEVGEADPALAVWWEALYVANDEERRRLLEALREPRELRGPRRVRKAPAPVAPSGTAPASGDGDGEGRATEAQEAGTPDDEDNGPPPTDPSTPRKRRRRRRRPAEPGPST